jgi:hypothetical protein
MKLGDLYVQLTAKGATELTTALDGAEKKAQRTAEALQKISNVLTIVGGAVTAFAIKSVYDFVKYTEQVDKMVKITGASAEAIQGLGYAAEQEHSSLEDLATGLKFLAKNMGDARDGSIDAQKKFSDLGISIYDTFGKLRISTDVLLDVAEKMKNTTNETDKTNIALNLLGRSGINMVPLLSLGRQEIERLIKIAKDLGIVLSDDVVKAGEELGNKLTNLNLSIMGVKLALGTTLMPLLTEWVTKLIPIVEVFKTLPDWIKRTGVELAILVTGIWGMEKALLAVGIASKGIGGVVALLVAAALQIGVIINYYKGLHDRGIEFENWYKEFMADVEDGIPVIEVFAKAVKKVVEVTDDLSHWTDYLWNAYRKVAITSGLSRDELVKYADEMEKTKKTTMEQVDAVDKYFDELYELDLQQKAAAASGLKLNEIFKWSTEDVKRFRNELEKLHEAEITLADVQKKLAKAFEDTFLNTIQPILSTTAEVINNALWGIEQNIEEMFKAMAMAITQLIIKLLLLTAVIKILEALNIPAGTLVRIIGAAGFENPQPDMWARKQGSDFGRNFNEGFGSSFRSPTPSPNPVTVVIHNATPSTYVEVFANLPDKDKQRLYERGIYPGQRRFEKR